ncbi:MAG: hypothetical protein DRI01_09555 [Chloroflexi bacterium]|nr:MAG: hypothetical protein DRI01_09555 [Chloroflexota bacterium]
MTVIRDYIENSDEAISLAIREAQVEGMKPQVTELFSVIIDTVSQREVEKLVAAAAKSQYGKDAKWDIGHWWQVVVPLPRYESRSLPALIIETRAYLVAPAEVSPGCSRRWWPITLVEPVGKPQLVVLPLCFLLALLDGNEDRYRIVGKDGQWTLREIAGLKQPLRLHDDLVDGLRHVFRMKPVADWLDDFGPRGHRLVPLVVGSLLGLMYQGESASVPLERQAYSQEMLIEIITSMGYGIARARRVLERAEPELGPQMTLEEATRVVLKYISEEG